MCRRLSWIFLLVLVMITGLTSCLSPDEGDLRHLGLQQCPRKGVLKAARFKKRHFNRIDSAFQSLVQNHRFNGALLMAVGGVPVYENYAGYADLQKKDTLDEHTAFQLASVSKQFTALAVMKLKEEGRLEYDDSIQKFFPGFPYSGITIRHLLTHRSGLPNYVYFCEKIVEKFDSPARNHQVLKLLWDSCPARYFMPDRRFNYSNTGYFLLAALVEQITAQPFEDYVRDELFLPLGMNRSYIKPNKPDDIREAAGHLGSGRKAGRDLFEGITGDKGVYSTPSDLLKWDQALKSGRVVSRQALEEAWMPGNSDMRGYSNYGFGFRIMTSDTCCRIVFHGGWWRGFKTLFLTDLTNDYTLVFLSNRENWFLGQSKEFFNVLYNGHVLPEMCVAPH